MNDLLLPAVQKSTQDLDPYYNLVSLHLKGDVSTGRNYNAFSDASSNNFRLTNNGDVRGSSFSPYNTSWSAYFDGTGDYLSLSNPNTNIGSIAGDFTIEFWVNWITPPPGNGSGNERQLIGQHAWPESSSGNWWAILGVNVGIYAYFAGGGSYDLISSSSFTWQVGTWYHVAVVRSGSTVTIYLNGTSVGSGTSTKTLCADNVRPLTIGADNDGSHNASNAYISNMRLVKGSAVYTGAFTPPTAPLTAISGTSLLTCQSNRFIDNSSNQFAITSNGDTRISSFAPFLDTDTTSGSGYFDGTGDNILTPSNTSFALGSDWTYELWFYPISQSGSGGIVGFTDNIDNLDYTLSSNSLIYYDGSTVTTWSGVNPVVGAWNHIAIVKSSGTIRAYVNGKQSTNTASGPTTSSARSVYIGSNRVGTSTTACYIADFRIVKGTAVYTANFTPPTQPLTAVANTQLLTLQERGAYNTVGFQDQSEYQHVITRNGNTTQGTFSPFSPTGWGNFFASANSSYLSGSANISGSGSWTYEAFVYLTAYAPGGFGKGIVSTDGTSQGWTMRIQPDGKLILGERLFANYVVSNDVVPLNTWVHVAAVRSGTTVSLFVNGVLQPTTGSFTQNLSSSTFVVGRTYTSQAADYWDGYLSNVRVVSGQALYSGNFTPPSIPFTTTTVGSTGAGAAASLTGTVTLLTCQSNRFRDASSNNTALTVNGSPSVQAFSPFKPPAYDPQVHAGSGYFDGTGDYLALPTSNPTLYPGSGAFTFECWIYPTGTLATLQAVFSYGGSAGNLRVFIQNGGLQIWNGATSFTAGNTALVKNNSWNHIVVQRDSSNYLTSYVNGTRDYYTVQTVDYNAGSLQIAADGGANLLTGYESGFSFIKGSATYSGATITVPIAPVTATTNNTSLLLNFTNAGVIDSTGKNVIETVGNAGVVTAIKKFGAGSMYFDGTGDYLFTPSSVDFVFNGDFTIEFWVYRAGSSAGGTGNYECLLATYNGSTGYGVWWLNTTNVLHTRVEGTTADTTTALSNSTWYHVAVTRSGSTVRTFVNGVQGSSLTSSATAANPGLYIGAQTINKHFNGYIQDLRITKGYARYTANFTPPTKALPTRGRAS